MAFYAFWILGLFICIASVFILWKTINETIQTTRLQKTYLENHPQAQVVKSSLLGVFSWAICSVLLLYMASSVSAMATDQYQPDRLVYFGCALFLSTKALAAWKDHRCILGEQNFVLQGEQIKLSQIRSIQVQGSRSTLNLKNGRGFIIPASIASCLLQKQSHHKTKNK